MLLFWSISDPEEKFFFFFFFCWVKKVRRKLLSQTLALFLATNFWDKALEDSILLLLLLWYIIRRPCILYSNIHTRHFDTQYCEKMREIDVFEPLISIDQGKAKVSSKWANQGTLCFVESLPWLVIEIQKYLFIAILCAKMSRVKKAHFVCCFSMNIFRRVLPHCCCCYFFLASFTKVFGTRDKDYGSDCESSAFTASPGAFLCFWYD